MTYVSRKSRRMKFGTFIYTITLATGTLVAGCNPSIVEDRSRRDGTSSTKQTDERATPAPDESSAEFTVVQSGEVRLGDDLTVRWDAGTAD